MRLFEVTKEMVAALGDEPLRQLLGRILAAEALTTVIESGSTPTAPTGSRGERTSNPGMGLWLLERSGRALAGWRPMAPVGG